MSGFLVKPFDLASLAKQLDGLYDDIQLHHQTQTLMSDKISHALADQQQKPELVAKPGAIVN